MSAATQAPPASDALTMSGAEVVLRALKDNGVEVIFGYPGGAVLPRFCDPPGPPSVRMIMMPPAFFD